MIAVAPRSTHWQQRQKPRVRIVGACLALFLAACEERGPAADSSEPVAHPLLASELPLPTAALVTDSMRPGLCERTGADVVRDTFCAESAPQVHSLAELASALKLELAADGGGLVAKEQGGGAYPVTGGAVLLGHSTALSGELVSPINPRAIVMSSSTFLAFTRGVQQVELAARDRDSQRLNMYLLSFRQACNLEQQRCKHSDLYTPSVESNWQQLALQDDEDLKNTPSDCRQCHQRGTEQPILLMRELAGPWTHFFSAAIAGKPMIPEPLGDDLLLDYVAAKGDETYAGVTIGSMRRTVGLTLQALVPAAQPLIFDGSAIMDERWPRSAGGYASEPKRSTTWQNNYEAFKRGEVLPLPFYAMRPTDPDKLAQLTAAYSDYRNGMLAPQDLPDLADIFADDPQTRAELGLQTEKDATPSELLIQACAPCHSDSLDQSLSRARFSIALGRLDHAELQAAAGRLQLQRGTLGAMPPQGRRQLDDAARKRLISYLKAASRPQQDEELLEHAAQLGMSQPQPKADDSQQRL